MIYLNKAETLRALPLCELVALAEETQTLQVEAGELLFVEGQVSVSTICACDAMRCDAMRCRSRRRWGRTCASFVTWTEPGGSGMLVVRVVLSLRVAGTRCATCYTICYATANLSATLSPTLYPTPSAALPLYLRRYLLRHCYDMPGTLTQHHLHTHSPALTCLTMSQDTDTGEEVEVSEMHDEAVLGEFSFFTGLPALCTAKALSTTDVLQIDFERILHTLVRPRALDKDPSRDESAVQCGLDEL
eukprot:933134-Rhodomonas_salina.1